jgi:TolB protein
MTEGREEKALQGAKPSRRRIWTFRLALLFALAAVTALAWLALRQPPAVDQTVLQPTLTALAEAATATDTPVRASPTTAPSGVVYTPMTTRSASQGALVFTARVRGASHLWIYTAGDPAPAQLTAGDWDDRDPALSPDGSKLAFASTRNGYWDLYLLDLVTGGLRQLTETHDFEGHPTWSPDGQWIAFEAYYDDDFDIWILPIEGDQGLIQLTNHPANDTSPSWDAGGRRIAFISDREGQDDVFLASLDLRDPITGEPILAENRFLNLTQSPDIRERDPVFSPDGTRLAYSERNAGLDQIRWVDLSQPDFLRDPIGQGHALAWSPDGRLIAAVLDSPGGSHIVSYAVGSDSGTALGFPIPQTVEAIEWSRDALPETVYSLAGPASEPTELYSRTVDPDAFGRMRLVRLAGVTAPNPSLSDAVDEAFQALRQRVVDDAGWDFLSELEYAFVGLNDPIPPGRAYDDWLFTGRAFAFDPAALQAGWVEIVREELQGRTYWHVFIRAATQDGSMGEPLREHPWDLEARFTGDPQAYDQGGQLKERIPQGYYVDFTRLAMDYGYERVPALANWRTFYQGTRFNEFVMREGLSWEQAMLQLYPSESILTPTPFITPTLTPTRTLRPTNTPWWYRPPTATPVPSTTPTPLPTPTGS